MWILQLGLRWPYTFGMAKGRSSGDADDRAFPPGTQPPSITEYDSPLVSILESGLESKVPAQKELLAIDLHAAGRGEIPVPASRTVVLAMLN
jgi:hypothetical protein